METKDKGMVVERCTVCGKVGNQHWFETVRTPNGTYLQLSSNFEDVRSRHPDLDVYELPDDNIGKFIDSKYKKSPGTTCCGWWIKGTHCVSFFIQCILIPKEKCPGSVTQGVGERKEKESLLIWKSHC